MNSILFDLDGTLIDSSIGIKTAFRYTFNQLKLPRLDDKHLSTFIGPPLETTFSQYFTSEKDITHAITTFRTYYNNKGVHQVSVYQHIPELLTSLQETGKHLFVTTSKNEPMAKLMLKEQKLDSYFDGIYGALPDRYHKADVIRACLKEENIKQNSAIIIGDTAFDMIGAKKAGISSIGVTWGFGRELDLLSNGAKLICHNPLDIKKALSS